MKGSGEGLTESDRLEAFMKLADFRRDRMKERSQYDWKMSLAYWAFLIAGTFYVRPRPPEYFLIILLVAGMLLHIWFIAEIRKRTRLDVEFAFYYIDHVELLLGLTTETPRNRPDFKKHMNATIPNMATLFRRDFWWSGLEITVTVGLTLCAYWLTGTLSSSALKLGH